MAKRTPNSSRPVDAARTKTTTTEPSATPVATPLAASEPSAAPAAVPLTASEPSPASVAVPPVLGLPPALVSLPAVSGTRAESQPRPLNLAGGTMSIEDTTGQVTRLYRAITGRDVPVSDAPYAPIPAAKDPVQHVEEQLARLLDVLRSTVTELGSY